MKRKLLTTISTSTSKQKSSIPGKGTDNLLRRFLVIRRVSLLVLLITIALLLAFILASFFIGWLREFSLGLLPIAIPLVFIIIRWVYRQLKDTNVPLYVITLIGMLLVTGAFYLDFYLDFIYHYDGIWEGFWLLLVEAAIAGAVFALALLLTSLGHLYYQITMMAKYRQQISALMLASTVVAAIIVIPVTIMVVAVMMRAARGDEDFLFVPFAVIFDVIEKSNLYRWRL